VRALTLSVFLKLYGVAVVAFFLIDMAWLGVVARSFYRAQMGHLMRANVNWAAAIVFYLVFVSGIVVLVVWPAIQRQSPGHALVLGALFGLVTYAAYDLTNLQGGRRGYGMGNGSVRIRQWPHLSGVVETGHLGGNTHR
jgi:uncharacterized membrane protein